jgi:hypothetical protein
MQLQPPLSWIKETAEAFQWPLVVLGAFWLGRVVSKLEARVLKAEKNVADLIQLHLPQVHRVLQDISNQLDVVKTLLFTRK